MPRLDLPSTAEVVSREGISLAREGGLLKGACPFHDDQHPSLIVWPEAERGWWCPVCGLGGDAATFVMRLHSLTFVEALDHLGLKRLPAAQQEKEAQERRLRGCLVAAMRWFVDCLPKSSGLRYALEERKLTQESLGHFGIGYAKRDLSGLFSQLKQLAFEEETWKAAGLTPNLGGRLVFPLKRPGCGIVSLYGRAVPGLKAGPVEPTHWKLPGRPSALFGLEEARGHEVVVCESPIDACSFHGVAEAIALCGLSAKPEELNPLWFRRFERVIICFDERKDKRDS